MEWEYLFVTYHDKYRPEVIINGEPLEFGSSFGFEDEKISLYEIVNDLGEEGWELVVTQSSMTSRIIDETRLIFKRQRYSPCYLQYQNN
jgi:hypothetical protein